MIYKEEEHKALHKKIWNCKCIPLNGTKYCIECEEAILAFLNEYGAGVLVQALLVEDLKKRILEIEDYNRSQAERIGRLEKEIIALKDFKSKHITKGGSK